MTGIFQIFDRFNALSARKDHASKNHNNHEEPAAKDNIIPSYYLLQGDDYMHRGPLDFVERPRKEHAEASGDSMGVVHRTSANNKKHIEVKMLVNSLSNVLNELQPGEVEQKLLRVSGVAFQETKSRHGVLFPDAQKELEDGSPNSMSGKEQSPSQKPHNIQPSEAPPSEICLSRLSSVSNDSRDSIKRGSKQLPPRDTRSTTLHASKHKEKPRTLLSSVQDSSSKEVFAAAASPTDSNKLVTQVLMQMEFSQRSSDGKVQAAGHRYHSSGDETEGRTQGHRNQLSGDESLEPQHNMKEAGARHGGKDKVNERIHQSSRAKEARLGHLELPPNEGCKHQSSVREGHRFYATSGDKKKFQRQHYSSAADDGDGREEEHRDKNPSLKEFHYKYPSSGDDKHSDCHRYMIPSLNKRELVGDRDYAIENQDPKYRSGNAEENKGHQVQSESGDEKKGGRYMYASVGVKGRRSPFLGKNNGHRYQSSGDEEWEGGQRLHDSSDRYKWKDHKLQLPVKEFAADGEEQRQGDKSPDNHQQEAGHRFLASRNGRVEGNTNSLHAKEVHEYWSESSSDEREVELLGHRRESSADERNLQGRNQLLSAPKGHRHDQSSCDKGEGQRFCLSHDSREDTYRHQSSSEKELDVKQAQCIQLPHSHQEKDRRRYLAAGDGRKLSPSRDYSSQQEGHRHQSSCDEGGSQGSQLESRLHRKNKLGHRTHLPAMEFIADAEQQGTISYQSPRYHQEGTLRFIAPGDEREGQRMNLHGKHRHWTSDDEKLRHRSQSSADVRKGPGANTSPAQEEGHRYRSSGDERKVRQRRQLSHINRREGTQQHFSVGGEHRQSYLSHWDHQEKGGKGHRSNSYAKGVHRSVSSGDTQGRHQFQERCRDRSLVAETWTYKSSGTDDVEENQRMESSRTLREAQRFTTCSNDEGGGPHSHHSSSRHRQQSASVKVSAQTHQSSADDRREGHRSPSSLDLNEFEHHHSSGDIMRHHKSDLSYDQNEAASKHCFLREPGKSNKHLAQAVDQEAEAHRHHHHHHHHHHQFTYSDEEEECQRHDSIDDTRIGHRDHSGAAKDARQRYQSSGDEKGGGAHCSHSSADEMNSQRCKSNRGHREVWYADSDEGYRHQSSLGLKESGHTLLPLSGDAMQGHHQSKIRLKEGDRHLHQNVLASPKHIEEELSPTPDVNSAPSKKAFAREGKWLQQLAISTSQAEPTSSTSNQSKSDHHMKEVGQIGFKQLKQVSARPQQSSLLKENYAMVKPRLRPRSQSRSMSPSASSQHKRDLYRIESQRPQHVTSKSSHQEGDQPWHKQLMSSKHLQMEAMPLVLKKPQVEHPPTEILLGEGMISDQRLHQLRIKNGLQEHKSLRQVLEAMHLKGLLKQPRGNKQVIMLNAKFLAGLGSSVQEAQSPPSQEAKIMQSSAVSNLARSGSMDQEYQDIVEFQDMLKEETKAHEEATAQGLNQGTEAPIVLMKPCSHQIPSPAAAPTPSPALQQILELESKASPVYNGLAKSPTTVTAPTGNDRENQNESSCTRGRRSLSGRALNKRRSSRSRSPSKRHSQEPAEFHSLLEEQVLSARTSKSECINTADKSRFSSKLEKSGEGFILKVNSQLLLPLHAGHHTSSMSKTPVFPSSGTETSDIVRTSQEGSRRIDDSSPRHCNANMKFPMATSEDKEASESTVMLMTSGSESICILQEPSSSCLRNKFSDEEGSKSIEVAAIQTRPTTAKNKSHLKLKTRVPSVELGLQTVVTVMDSSDASRLSASPRSTTAEELTKLMKEKQESVSEVTQEAPNGQGLEYQAPHQGGDGSTQGSFVIHINSSGSFNSGCQEAKLIESTGNQVVAVTKLSDGVTAGVSLMKQQVAEEEEEEEEMGELAGNANHPSPVSVLDSASFEEELTHTPKCVKSSTISHEGNLHSVNSEQQQSYNKLPSFLDGEKWDIVLKAQNSPDGYQDDEWAYYVKEILAMSELIIEEACPCIDAVPNKSIKSVMKTEELNSQLKESSSVQEDEEKGNREDNKKMMMFQQSLLHQQLFTDGVKEIVGNGMKPFTDPQPWGAPNLRRKPAGQHLIQEVWDELQDMHCLVTDAYNVLYAILKKDLTRKAFQWQDFSTEIGEVGFELGDLIFEEMLKAAVQELMAL